MSTVSHQLSKSPLVRPPRQKRGFKTATIRRFLPHSTKRIRGNLLQFTISGSIDQRKLKATELFFKAPLDQTDLSFGTIRIFARSVTRHEIPTSSATDKENRKRDQRPWLLWLQGGPGQACAAPRATPFIDLILDRGYQILYIDQRGTGLSTPVSAETLVLRGDAQQQADYLKLFRADSIVGDCEAIRKLLVKDYPPELRKWSVFGQSFGGFCAFTYLSKYPEGLKEVFTAGGVPPIRQSLEAVYRSTFRQVCKRNRAYYQKFPEDIRAIHDVMDHIKFKGGLQLPSGGTLTARRFLTLGMGFSSHGRVDAVHEMIFRMHSDLEQFDFITRPTLSALERMGPSFDDNIIYSILREAMYCQGEASKWAAERVGRSLREFDWISGSPASFNSKDQPLYFSGEMVYPFMFEIYPELKKLKEVAQIIAHYRDWPELYDEDQLATNEVPIYAAIFLDDASIDFGLVQETLERVANCKQFVTNTMYHDAIRSKTVDVMKELLALRDDVMD